MFIILAGVIVSDCVILHSPLNTPNLVFQVCKNDTVCIRYTLTFSFAQELYTDAPLQDDTLTSSNAVLPGVNIAT